MPTKYWLFKTEPETFSWKDLEKAPKKTTCWDGVRNYQARNFLRDDIKIGDGVLFYHSVVNPQVIVGTATVAREGYPDPSQFDPKSKYFDPKASPDAPRWYMVDIRLEQAFQRPLSLAELKEVPALEKMELLRKGSRLSVQPVTAAEWKIVVKLGAKR